MAQGDDILNKRLDHLDHHSTPPTRHPPSICTVMPPARLSWRSRTVLPPYHAALGSLGKDYGVAPCEGLYEIP